MLAAVCRYERTGACSTLSFSEDVAQTETDALSQTYRSSLAFRDGQPNDAF